MTSAERVESSAGRVGQSQDRRPRRRSRDRRGRGMRGPGVLPRPWGTATPLSGRDRFDHLVLESLAPLEDRWGSRLGSVEYAVEDTPVLPEDWGDAQVPLSSLVPGHGADPARLVLFRRPIERRATDRTEVRALVHTVLVEQLAELLGLGPEALDPRYESPES